MPRALVKTIKKNSAPLLFASIAHLVIFVLLATPRQETFLESSSSDPTIDILLSRPSHAEDPSKPRRKIETPAHTIPETVAVPQSVTAPHRPAQLATNTSVTQNPSPSIGPTTGPTGAPQINLGKLLGSGAAGCRPANLAKLSDDDRTKCAEAMGAATRTAPYYAAAIAPENRAYYDAIVASRKDPGRAPTVGCKVLFGPNREKARAAPTNSATLGPCYIAPPVGVLTPEAGVQGR